MTVPKYPQAQLDIDRLGSNALDVVAGVTRALRAQEVPSSDVLLFQQRALSADYDHVLRTAAGWVSLRSDAGQASPGRAGQGPVRAHRPEHTVQGRARSIPSASGRRESRGGICLCRHTDRSGRGSWSSKADPDVRPTGAVGGLPPVHDGAG